MVSAVNPGGKAESIASFAVMEKTPERVVEVIKTVVYEDPKDHTRKVSQKILLKIENLLVTATLKIQNIGLCIITDDSLPRVN